MWFACPLPAKREKGQYGTHLRPRDVEVIRGRVGDPGQLAGLSLATGILRNDAAYGADPLDACRSGEDALTLGGLRAQQQPGDGVRVRCVVPRFHHAHHLAAVVGLPGWAGVVAPDLAPVRTEQLGFRRLESPFEARRLVLAGGALVDLHARCRGGDGQHFVCWHLQVFREVGNGPPFRRRTSAKECEEGHGAHIGLVHLAPPHCRMGARASPMRRDWVSLTRLPRTFWKRSSMTPETRSEEHTSELQSPLKL